MIYVQVFHNRAPHSQRHALQKLWHKWVTLAQLYLWQWAMGGKVRMFPPGKQLMKMLHSVTLCAVRSNIYKFAQQHGPFIKRWQQMKKVRNKMKSVAQHHLHKLKPKCKNNTTFYTQKTRSLRTHIQYLTHSSGCLGEGGVLGRQKSEGKE